MAESEVLFSQASVRSYRFFRDQHGREYGADIENKTQAPCGPLAPRFSAPLMPPQKYLLLIDAAGARLRVDYEQWIQDAEEALRDHETREFEQAVNLFGDKAPQAIEERNPALLRRVGTAPAAVEPIKAAQAGNGWILGLKQKNGESYPMPEAAKAFFKEEKLEENTAWDEPAEILDDGEHVTFPVHTSFGNYVLSNGKLVKGKEAAEAAQAALGGNTQEFVAAGSVDNSWLEK